MPNAQATHRTDFTIAGTKVRAGSVQRVEIPVSVTSDHTPVNISAYVRHGREAGPVVLVSAAVHGDEIIGVEIVRRLIKSRRLKSLHGTLIAVPIVNTLGFINRSRYLPDRRDLNRSFPGSEAGSLAGRLAYIFLNEVVRLADVGIDLHSAAIHRTNLPQMRIAQDNPKLVELANAFAAPVIITSPLRTGSLREAAREIGVNQLIYESGEALRFDETAVRIGERGILRVLAHLGMISGKGLGPPKLSPLHARSSFWVRAPAGGLLRTYQAIGESVRSHTTLGMIADPFGAIEIPIQPDEAGVIIGRTNLPLVNEGDALFHIARVERVDTGRVRDRLAQQIQRDEMFDEDEII